LVPQEITYWAECEDFFSESIPSAQDRLGKQSVRN
jgi:hypothetical protein